jgi:peptidylprolyl isomerase
MIPGFIEGLEKLSFGDKAILFIPSHLAYGAGGVRCNSSNTNIVFEIELLEAAPQ